MAHAPRPRLLVVEDEYLNALYVVESLDQLGAEVVGPVASVTDALALLATEAIDGAILDVNLDGEPVFPVADALGARGIPFVFASGYDVDLLPEHYRSATVCLKPVDASCLATMIERFRRH